MASSSPSNGDTLKGFFYALTAYLLWGFLPLFMKQLSHIPPAEVVAHRVVWSIPIAGAVLWAAGQLGDLRLVFAKPRMLGMGVITATLISLNWGIYVWAIGTGHALEAALGYCINPLFSIFLGRVLLGERLTRPQQAAIALAAVAVTVLTWETGRVPVVALGLTVTWGFYAYFKRALPIGANQGFMLEVLMILPFALAYIGWTGGAGHFVTTGAWDTGLLMLCGVVTAVPMMIYSHGAKGLRLSTIGIMQYIAPTMIFLTAVFLFDEPLDRPRLLAFGMIWAALALYTGSMLVAARRARAVQQGA